MAMQPFVLYTLIPFHKCVLHKVKKKKKKLYLKNNNGHTDTRWNGNI